MGQTNSQKVFKAVLILIIELCFIGCISFVITTSNTFQQSVNLDLKCLDLNQIDRLCISTYQRNNTIIPHNKGVKAIAKFNVNFKILTFEQKSQILQKNYHNSIQEYFYLVQFDQKTKSIDQIKLQSQVPSISHYLVKEKGSFRDEKLKEIELPASIDLVVFYLVLPAYGPIKYQSAVRIIYPNRQSIHLNNTLSIVQSIFIYICIVIYSLCLIQSNNINIAQFTNSPIGSKLNRIFQFVLNFGMNHVIYLLTVYNFWTLYNLGFVENILQLSKNVVPRYQANAYESVILLFPEWLMLGFMVYQIYQKYIQTTIVKLIILSGLSSAVLFIVPTVQAQFILCLSATCSCLFLASYTKYVSNNKYTVTFLLTAFSLVSMVVVKMVWYYFYRQSNDFMVRFFYNQIFIVTNFVVLFINQEQSKTKQHRQYIPYDQNHMQEEQG